MEKLYAQLDSNNICHTISNIITDIECNIENLGQKYLGDGLWEEINNPINNEMTIEKLAQMVSDLQADLMIAGIIK